MSALYTLPRFTFLRPRVPVGIEALLERAFPGSEWIDPPTASTVPVVLDRSAVPSSEGRTLAPVAVERPPAVWSHLEGETWSASRDSADPAHKDAKHAVQRTSQAAVVFRRKADATKYAQQQKALAEGEGWTVDGNVNAGWRFYREGSEPWAMAIVSRKRQ